MNAAAAGKYMRCTRNTDFAGADAPGMPISVPSEQECVRRCQADPQCLALVYHSPSSQACWLKYSANVSVVSGSTRSLACYVLGTSGELSAW